MLQYLLVPFLFFNIAYGGAINIANLTNSNLSFSLVKKYISKGNADPKEHSVTVSIAPTGKHKEDLGSPDGLDPNNIQEIICTFVFDGSTYTLSELNHNNVITAQISRNVEGVYLLTAYTEKGKLGTLRATLPGVELVSDIPKRLTIFDKMMYKIADLYKYIRGYFS
jgi:hypothetical protein